MKKRAAGAITLLALVSCSSGLGDYPDYAGRDLDCSDVNGPVRVDGPDPHGLDRDNDGVGCE